VDKTLATVTEVLAVIASAPDGIVSSEEVGDQLGLNPVVVRRMLAPMRAAGHVEARRGVGGGWAIARDPAKLSVGDLYRTLHDGATPAIRRAGPLTDALAAAEAAYLAELDQLTLEQVIESRHARTPVARNM
jgi:DNA-binding IscR family transcriptional regulator